MNYTEAKKFLEGYFLDAFLGDLGELPPGDVKPSERPDFLIRRGNRILGVDVTTLHVQTADGKVSLQASQAMRWRVARLARELYARTNLPAVDVNVRMDCDAYIPKARVGELAASIVDCVIKNLPATGRTSEVFAWNSPGTLVHPISSVRVFRYSRPAVSFFGTNDSAWLTPLAVSDVERALARKESCYAAYRARCDEAWLVICVDTFMISTVFRIDDDAPVCHTYSSSFDRAFLWRHSARKIHELRLR